MTYFPNAITPSCTAALQYLSKQAFIRDYYLAGGTALALQLGHRLSTDLDWFSTTQSLLIGERDAIRAALEESQSSEITSEKDGMLFGRLYGADVSFIYQQHPLLYPTVIYQGINLASPVDIGLMKLAAINSRGTRRDFIDLYCMRDLVGVDDLLALVPTKYANRPSFLAVAARALAYFDDAEQQAMPDMYVRVEWKAVRVYFEDAARRLTRQLAGLS